MTPTLPRPIEAGEIRVGDRVARHWSSCGANFTAEYTVASIEGRHIYTGHGVNPGGSERDDTWTLLDRPTPAPKSWRKQLADELREWADKLEHVSGYWDGYIDGIKQAASAIQNSEFGKSIPDIPDHGDGCSPWLWDPADGVRYVCADDGSYIGISGSEIGWRLRTRHRDQAKVIERLRPWSERGQANG